MGRTIDSDGFTVITPTNNNDPVNDSRLIYVSETGDDAAAAAIYNGRGYYLPTDSEIGSDPTQPVGTIVAYKTARAAAKRLRGTGWTHTDSNGVDIVSITVRDSKDAPEPPNPPLSGWPDWIMFKRGDTFSREADYQSTGWGLLSGDIGYIVTSFAYVGQANTFRYEAGYFRGKSEDEPFVITAWGNPSDPRPIIRGGFSPFGRFSYGFISSLDVQPTTDLVPNRTGITFGNCATLKWAAFYKVRMEDCRSQGHGMLAIQGGGPTMDLEVYRCTFLDGWNAGGHNSSPFNGLNEGAKFRIFESLFDKNGYKENPNDATKWTANHNASLFSAEGTGIQPKRTYFDRNWYMAGDAGDTLVLQGNLVCRTGGGGEQMRSGGLLHGNTFLFCHDGMLYGAPEDSYGVHDSLSLENLHLHDDVFYPAGGWGMNNFMQGGHAVLYDNIYSLPHERTASGTLSGAQNGPGTIFMWNIRNYERKIRALRHSVIYTKMGFTGFGSQASIESKDHPQLIIDNNAFAFNNGLANNIPTHSFGYGAVASSTKEFETIDYNNYLGTASNDSFLVGYTAAPRGLAPNMNFTEWQTHGFDVNGTMESNFATFAAANSWNDPDRDIISYVQYISPGYTPDSEVYVDHGVSVPQVSRQKLKDVLPSTFTAAEKTKAAERFHAFITFITRARENRKGYWDPDYTAVSLNNYIRSGFGKGNVNTLWDVKLQDISQYSASDMNPPQPCIIEGFDPGSVIVTADGGNFETTISTNSEACSWAVTSDQPWVTFLSPTESTGLTGLISFNVAENTGTEQRVASIRTAGKSCVVYQEGSVCQVTNISTQQVNVVSNGGSVTITADIVGGNSCVVIPTTSESWIQIQPNGPEPQATLTPFVNSFTVTVPVNPIPQARIGTLNVGPIEVVFIQNAASDIALRNHVHVLKGAYKGHIEKPKVKEYVLDLKTDKIKTLTKFSAVCGQGTPTIKLMSNYNGTVTTVSTINVTGSLTSNILSNQIEEGAEIYLEIQNVIGVQDIKFSVEYFQDGELNVP